MVNNESIDHYSREIDQAAIDFIYSNLKRITLSVTLMPLLLVAVMWPSFTPLHLLAWLLLSLIVIIARLYLVYDYRRASPTINETPRWGDYFAWTSLLSGLTWGYASYAFYLPESAAHQVFLYTCTIGLVSGSIPVSANWFRSYLAFSVPAMLGMSLRLIVEGGYANTGLAVLLLMYMGVAIYIAKNTNRVIRESLYLRFQNLDLVGRLSAARDEAEKANRDKTRVLASASHDLRQPVFSLSLLNEALHHEVTTERGREILAFMEAATNGLNELLTSLLDISKLDAGIVTPVVEPVALNELFGNLVREYQPQAEKKGLSLYLRQCEGYVMSDSSLLGNILRNLLSNAIRYSEQGWILIACRSRGRDVAIEIRDTGIGIPLEEQSRIFEEFHQVNNPERDRSKGLGLGLAICKRLGHMLGHDIEVRSIPGRGSVFRIVISKTSAECARRDKQPPVVNRDLQGTRILVVDDDLSVRRGMEAILSKWGCDVSVAEGILEAEQIAAETPPELIIADFRLRDGTTGVEAIDSIRTLLKNEVPAMLITGDTAPERIQEAKISGHLLMHKPVSAVKLRSAIGSLLSS